MGPSHCEKCGSATFFFINEINLRKKKWLMCGYNPNNFFINKFTYDIGKVMDSFIGNYDNFLVVGDLNSELLKAQCCSMLNTAQS